MLPPSRMVLWIFQEKWEPPVWNRQLTSSFKASMYHLGWVHISSPAAYFIVALQKKPSATAALLICCCAGVPLWNWWLQRLLKAASISENCYKLPNICTHHTLSNISTLKAKSLYNWKSGPELINSPSYMIYCFPSFVAEGSGVGDVDDQYVFFSDLK